MKKTFRLFFAAVAAIVFASCADKMGNEINAPEGGATVQDGDLVQMTFSASMSKDVDSKTTYLSRKVYWEATDAITVFSVGESVTKTRFADPELLENRAIARFSGLANASAETYYAVYPHSDANTYDNGTFSVTFPSEQTAVVNGFESGSNVSVAVSTDQNLQFKNVGALLAFSFKDLETALNTASVTFKAKKNDTDYWGLAGATTFALDENNLPVAVEGDKQAVVVNAPSDGFKTGVVYFIPVIPVGACTGMELVYTDLNGDIHTKNNDVEFELLRSYMFNVGQLPKPSYLPENFTITLDFAQGWPFSTPIAEAQAAGGETYIYTLQVEDKEFKIPVVIDGNGSPYTYTGEKYITFGVNGAGIKAHAFADMYLTNVKAYKTRLKRFVLPSGSGSPWYIRWYDWSLYEDKSTIKYEVEESAGVMTGYEDTYTKISTKNMSYTVKVRDPSANVTKVEFTYSRTSPGPAPTAAATSAE